MNKKAQTDIPMEPSVWIKYIILLIVLPIGTAFFGVTAAHAKIVGDVASPRIEMKILEYRFLNSPGCFAYQDPDTNRIYSEIIDLEKFNDRQFLNCYLVQKDSQKRCFSLELQYDDQSKTIYSNNWVRCKVGQRTVTESRIVLVKDDQEIKRARLMIHKEKYT